MKGRFTKGIAGMERVIHFSGLPPAYDAVSSRVSDDAASADPRI